jgi:hypothetical protein
MSIFEPNFVKGKRYFWACNSTLAMLALGHGISSLVGATGVYCHAVRPKKDGRKYVRVAITVIRTPRESAAQQRKWARIHARISKKLHCNCKK